MKNLILFIWVLYLLFLPIQIFPSGSLQIADYVFLFGILFSLWHSFKKDIFINYYFYFVIYSILLSLFYFYYYQKIEFLKNPLNYFYCFLVVLTISKIIKENAFKFFSIYAIYVSQLIQVLLYFLIFDSNQLRTSLYFNNPNQLGFWAFCTMIIISIFIHNGGLNKLQKLLAYNSILFSFFFIILSISQAAILSSIFIIFFLFSKQKKIILFLFFLIVCFILIEFTKIETYVDEIRVISNVQERLISEIEGDDGDNGLDGRNYTRLSLFPQYLIFGAGETGYLFNNERFNNDLEIHSTFINLIFSYGIVGFLIYSIPFFIFFRKRYSNILIVIFAFILFTLVHNMLRWPLFWLTPYFLFRLVKYKIDKNIMNK